MKKLFLAASMALCLASPGFAQENSKIVIADEGGDGGYRIATDPALAALRNDMVRRAPLENWVQFMQPMRLNKTLRILAKQCDAVNMWYDPSARTITVCYEFLKWVDEQVAVIIPAYQQQNAGSFPVSLDREAMITGTFAGVVLHETGHALFDILEVPVFGMEEDAADQLAAFVALQFDRRVAETVTAAHAATVLLFGDRPTAAPDTQAPDYPESRAERCQIDPMCAWSDEHGSGSQRFYNTACLVYGSDPERYSNWLAAGWVPPDRDCVSEYRRVADAFSTTIGPFMDLQRVDEVRSRNWLLPKSMPPFQQ